MFAGFKDKLSIVNVESGKSFIVNCKVSDPESIALVFNIIKSSPLKTGFVSTSKTLLGETNRFEFLGNFETCELSVKYRTIGNSVSLRTLGISGSAIN